MRIAFDHQAFCRQTAGGISRYFCRLADALAHQQQEIAIFAPVYRNRYLKELPSTLVHGYGIKNYPPKSAEICVAANAWIAKPLMHQWKPDLVHETYFSKHGMRLHDRPSVLTVFDMISELDALQAAGQIADFRQSVKFQSVNRADHVICISEHTRQDLLKLFNVPETKVSVVHLGCEQLDDRQISMKTTSQSIADPSAKYHSRPFLLYVGIREGYKNFEQMLRAIAASSSIQKTFDLIAFGGGTFNETEQALLVTLGYRSEQVKQVNGNDQVLNVLYQQAAALIYPSTYEGFGLPPLEAMAMQCPVVSSDTSSMPEVIGDAAEYFDPHQIDSMRCAIERVVFSEERTRALIEKGNAHVKQFTWAQCAEKTLKIYQTLSPDLSASDLNAPDLNAPDSSKSDPSTHDSTVSH